MVNSVIKYLILIVSFSMILNASWWNDNWKYRVSITINSAVANQTGKVNIDFSTLGLSRNLDENSVRVVKENGTLLFKQEFTDILYNDVTLLFKSVDTLRLH